MILLKNIVDNFDNKTLIIIAHHLETIKDVDNIYVLKDGLIKENGKYRELLSNDGYFKELYEYNK